MNLMGNQRTFPLEITAEEAEAGFSLRESEIGPGGPRVLVAVLDLVGGLRAVKTVRPPSDEVEYAIWDQGSVSIYISARTLAELLRRFRSG